MGHNFLDIIILYLFTLSDLKTIVLPVYTIFAYLTAPHTTVERMLYALLWTWLHLLQFCVSNQSLDPEEDASNKPWRPIPSGLMSVVGARALRWVLLPSCFFLSVYLEAYWQGISLALAFLAHNEFGLHSHMIMRNVCNAWGYASFNAGASVIAAGHSTMTTRTTISFAINALVILSTIHAQDFRDEVGDKLMGRRTIPIVWPEASRIGILVMLAAWSIGLSWVYGLASIFSVPFCAWAFFVGLRFFRKRTAEADKLSYRYYNIWLAAAQIVHVPVIATALSVL
ncbi:UbiA prenyltransferase family [Multifurca ochricompacta]|uniref:UbiA prenyltransferase family n=1 Tax=Multifurca ochricompacta TaxID=376703 RepID=A0AAD4QKT6_9AGAM|nr:UbiA prenyltransferase family [Multifurca ochricompacta]